MNSSTNPRKKANSFFVQLVANWSSVFVAIIATVISYPLLISRLGEVQYGAWLIIASITGYATLLQAGVPTANVKFLALHLGKGDYRGAGVVLATNLLFFSAIAVLLFVSGLLAGDYVTSLFDIPEEFVKAFGVAFLLAVSEVCVRFAFESFEGLIHAQKRFVELAIIRNTCTVLRLIGFVLLVYYDSGLITIGLIVLASTVLQAILLLAVAAKPVAKMNITFSDPKLETLKQTLGVGGFILLLQLSSKVGLHSSPLIVGAIVSVDAVVFFGLANSLVMYVGKFVGSISDTLLPFLSEREQLSDTSEAQVVYQRGLKMVALLLVPILATLYFHGSFLIQIWVGEEFVDSASVVLKLLVLGFGFHYIQSSVLVPLLIGISKIKFITLCYGTTASCAVVAAIVLGLEYKTPGIAAGLSGAYLLGNIVACAWAIRTFEIRFRSFLRACILPIALAIAIATLIQLGSIYGLGHFPINIFTVLLSCGLATLVYGLVVMAFVLSKQDIELLPLPIKLKHLLLRFR